MTNIQTNGRDKDAGESSIALRVDNVTKRYGTFTALHSVSLDIRRGSIHGLLGENGAGKSTLVGIISGQRTPSSGTIYLNSEPVQGADVKAMEEAGVFLVTQEPMIIDHISASENLMLGIWPSRGGFVRWKKLKADAARMLKDSGIDPAVNAGRLNAVQDASSISCAPCSPAVKSSFSMNRLPP